jgi:pilus assembly protein CpaE
MSMMPITAALLISNRQLWEQTHSCIQSMQVRIALEQNDLTGIDELLDRMERHRTDVVLVEAHLLPIPLEEFVRRVRASASQPAVFVLHLEASSQSILDALHAGASEYLHPPLVEPMRKAFERLSAERAQTLPAGSGGLGRIFGFISAKGGCGATTFASHVAPEAARQLNAPVLLADFDFDAGILRFITKSKPAYSVRDALDNLHRMDLSYWKALISTHKNLDVIPAPDDLAAKRPGEPKETAHLMRFIRSMYQAAVVDFGRHFSCSALHSLAELDCLYILASPSLDDLESARDCIDMAREQGFPANRIKVLLNRVPERLAPDAKQVEKLLGIVPSDSFPFEPDSLYDAWSEGRLLEGNTKLGKRLQRLATSIVARVTGATPEPVEAPAANAGGVKRLFSFLQRAPA